MVKKKTPGKTTASFEPEQDEAKLKAVDAVIADITKRYGDGTIMRLGEAKHLQVDVVPTGSLGLDIAIGVGGMPRGRIVEIYGAESSGKTTLCLHVIAEAQKRGGLCAFVDMEHALDPNYAERIGVNIDTLFVTQPDTGEQALEITESLVRSGALDVVVVDSVAALVPRAEIEGEMGDSHVGLQARLMSQALRKLAGAVKQSNVCLIFTNQLREKVGVMFGCFHYSARVVLADGTTEKIGKIVTQKMDVEVMSYNVQTGIFEPKRVVNWFNNGKTEQFLQFVVDSNQGRGRREFGVTENHLMLTPDGYRPAGELSVGDVVMVAEPVEEADLALASLAVNVGGSASPSMVVSPAYHPVAMPILSIKPKPVTRNMSRYDIEVEGNHCYLVDGVVVHNSPETQPGGRALKFYATVRLDIRKTETIKQGEDVVGSRTKVKVKKNKVAAPFKECDFDIMYFEGGISKTGEIIDLGVLLGLIEKRGAFFRYNDGLLGQGRENARQFLLENPAIALELENAIRKHHNMPPVMPEGGE
jgi:recombination protein RecA